MIVEHGSLYWYCDGLLTHYKELRDRNRYVYVSGSIEFEEYIKYNSFYTKQINLMYKLMIDEFLWLTKKYTSN